MKTEEPFTITSAIAVVLIRIFAVLLLFDAIPSLSYAVWSLTANISAEPQQLALERFATVVNFIIGSANLALALPALIFARSLARIITPKHADAQISVNANDLVTLGGFLIGLFYLVRYVPELASETVKIGYRVSTHEPGYDARINVFDYETLAIYGSIVLIAFFLAFRPQQIAKFFGWLRSAGHARPEPPEEERE